jgi:gliding motility-associated-like protein
MKIKNLLFFTCLFCTISSWATPLKIENESITDENCKKKGQITLEMSGGKPFYHFKWSNGDTTATAKNLSVGTYSVTISDSEMPAQIIQATYSIEGKFETPLADAGLPMQITCAVDSVFLTGSYSNDPNTSSIIYEWSTVFGHLNSGVYYKKINVKGKGWYYLTVRDNKTQCETTDSVLVTASADMPIADAGPIKIWHCDTILMYLDGTGSSQGPEFTYFWDNANSPPHVLGWGNTLKPLVDYADTYTLRVTNTNTGCSSIASTQVVHDWDNPRGVNPFAGQPDIDCYMDTIKLIFEVMPPTNDYFYEWKPLGNGVIVGPNNQNSVLVSEKDYYELKVTKSSNGCVIYYIHEIFKDTIVPIASAGLDQFLDCKDTISLIFLDGSASSNYWFVYYNWYYGNGAALSGQSSSPSIYVNQGGTYIQRTIDTENGCFTKDTVNVYDSHNYAIVADTSADLNCTEKTVTFLGKQVSNSLKYEWQDAQGNVISSNNQLTTAQTGAYIYMVSDSTGACRDTFRVRVELDTVSPQVVLPDQIELRCDNLPTELVATANFAHNLSQFIWKKLPNQPLPTVGNTLLTNEIGSFSVVAVDLENNCRDTAFVETWEATPIFGYFTKTPPVCFGEKNGSIRLDSLSDWHPPIEIRLNNGQKVTISVFPFIISQNLAVGAHTLALTDAHGCAFDTILTMAEPPKLTADLGNDFSVRFGASADLQLVSNAQPTATIHWTGADLDKICPNCWSQTISPSEPGFYAAQIIDNNGCTATDSIFVDLERFVYVPNVFSPTADNSNSYFAPITQNNLDIIETFRIFDRWGEAIFEIENRSATDPKTAWDGTFRGKKMPDGVYTWMLNIHLAAAETRQLTGSVTLISK